MKKNQLLEKIREDITPEMRSEVEEAANEQIKEAKKKEIADLKNLSDFYFKTFIVSWSIALLLIVGIKVILPALGLLGLVSFGVSAVCEFKLENKQKTKEK